MIRSLFLFRICTQKIKITIIIKSTPSSLRSVNEKKNKISHNVWLMYIYIFVFGSLLFLKCQTVFWFIHTLWNNRGPVTPHCIKYFIYKFFFCFFFFIYNLRVHYRFVHHNYLFRPISVFYQLYQREVSSKYITQVPRINVKNKWIWKKIYVMGRIKEFKYLII